MDKIYQLVYWETDYEFTGGVRYEEEFFYIREHAENRQQELILAHKHGSRSFGSNILTVRIK